MATGQGKDLLLAMLIVFIAFFAFSQGAVIWVYLAEIFPTAVRSRGQALGSATHWGMNALIAQVFPMIAAYTQALPFAFFAACMVVQFFVVLAIFPGDPRRGAGVDGQGTRKESRSRLHEIS